MLYVPGRADASRGLGVGAFTQACRDRVLSFPRFAAHVGELARHERHKLAELMELGGWKSYEMVLRYAHMPPEHLSAAAQRIERAWGVVDKKPHDFPTLETSTVRVRA